MNFEAAIFDMDGVITDTAAVHSAAWKLMFDEYLQSLDTPQQEPFREFTAQDYLEFVDGRPRYRGVESFLKSRGICVPFGDPTDEPGNGTVCGLGNLKNELFNCLIGENGVRVFDSTIQLIHKLLRSGVKVGVATSSNNCALVLEKAGIVGLFETRVDGVLSAKLGLRGKPEPDIFATACDKLGASRQRTVIVEDAVSGVQAGLRGQFGMILGVARENNSAELRRNGADVVVSDLSEISLQEIDSWFGQGAREYIASL